ncbi:MAG: hypothetical protein LBB62_05090 [Proteiniphilum sp.]|jgi:hypothetical protein|nr:hypothetical protein [Proteiniphilum sp.]
MKTKDAIFAIDRSRVMKKAWEMKRGRTKYLYKTFGDALRAAWCDEKLSVSRMNDRYDREHGRGRYAATSESKPASKSVSLTEKYGQGIGDSLVEYYSHSGRYTGD